MNFNRDWKHVAMLVCFMLVSSLIGNGIEYFRTRNSYLSAITLIPDWVFVQAAKPYLVATIASAVATVIAWILYFRSKYKVAILIGFVTFVFLLINFFLVGERWSF
jgi:hypothetical protein